MPGFYGGDNSTMTSGPAQSGGFYGAPVSGPTQAPGAASGFYGQPTRQPTQMVPHMPQLAGEPARPSTSGRNDFGLYYFDDNGPTGANKGWGGLTPARR